MCKIWKELYTKIKSHTKILSTRLCLHTCTSSLITQNCHFFNLMLAFDMGAQKYKMFTDTPFLQNIVWVKNYDWKCENAEIIQFGRFLPMYAKRSLAIAPVRTHSLLILSFLFSLVFNYRKFFLLTQFSGSVLLQSTPPPPQYGFWSFIEGKCRYDASLKYLLDVKIKLRWDITMQ